MLTLVDARRNTSSEATSSSSRLACCRSTATKMTVDGRLIAARPTMRCDFSTRLTVLSDNIRRLVAVLRPRYSTAASPERRSASVENFLAPPDNTSCLPVCRELASDRRQPPRLRLSTRSAHVNHQQDLSVGDNDSNLRNIRFDCPESAYLLHRQPEIGNRRPKFVQRRTAGDVLEKKLQILT